MIEALEALAGSFGIGRAIHLGDTIIGTKGRVAFEAPAAETLLIAHRELEKLVLTRAPAAHQGARLRSRTGISCTRGSSWIRCAAISRRCFCHRSERVTGDVRCCLRPGSVFVEGVESPYSLMRASRGVYGESAGEWTAIDALGFSKIAALTGMFYRRAGEHADAARP